MAKDPIVPGEYYHVFNRGVEKRDIFSEKGDYTRFQTLLLAANVSKPVKFRDDFPKGRTFGKVVESVRGEEPLVHIGAYCLMPNHFHLLVYEYQEGGLSRFLQKLVTGYTMYFNTKYDRSGGLFQGKTKKKRADSEEYLRYLFAYIHLNPVELFQPGWKEDGIFDSQTARDFLLKYDNSSYADYMGRQREENVLLNREAFPEYFDNVANFDTHINDFLTYEQIMAGE